MAKAAEWAGRFDGAADLGAELQAFIGEIGDIAQARGGTPNAVEGAVREQKAKFMAVCGRTPKVTPNMWPVLMQAHGGAYMDGVHAYLKSCEPKKPARGEKDKKWGGKPKGGPRAEKKDRAVRTAA